MVTAASEQQRLEIGGDVGAVLAAGAVPPAAAVTSAAAPATQQRHKRRRQGAAWLACLPCCAAPAADTAAARGGSTDHAAGAALPDTTPFASPDVNTCGESVDESGTARSSSAVRAGGHHPGGGGGGRLNKLALQMECSINQLLSGRATHSTDCPDYFDAQSELSFQATGSSEADTDAVQDAGMAAQAMLELPPQKGPWMPNPPLRFAAPGTRFVPITGASHFCAYWAKDDEASALPYPTPIDVMLKNNKFVCDAHSTIRGVKLHETDSHICLSVKPQSLAAMKFIYEESFAKDGSTTRWLLRRDAPCAGYSLGQAYMTEHGELVLRVTGKSLWGGSDWVCEEYLTLQEGGQVILMRQYCLQPSTGRTAEQKLVGVRRALPTRAHAAHTAEGELHAQASGGAGAPGGKAHAMA